MAVSRPESMQSIVLGAIPSGLHMPSLDELDALAAEGQEVIGLDDEIARAAYRNRYVMRSVFGMEAQRRPEEHVSPELGAATQRLRDRRRGAQEHGN